MFNMLVLYAWFKCCGKKLFSFLKPILDRLEKFRTDKALKDEVRSFVEMSPLSPPTKLINESKSIQLYEHGLELTDGVSEPLEDFVLTNPTTQSYRFDANVYEKSILNDMIAKREYLTTISNLIGGCVRSQAFQNNKRVIVAVATMDMAKEVLAFLEKEKPNEVIQFVGKARNADKFVRGDATIVIVLTRGNYAGISIPNPVAMIQTVPSGNDQLNRDSFRLLNGDGESDNLIFISVYNKGRTLQDDLMDKRNLTFNDAVTEGWI